MKNIKKISCLFLVIMTLFIFSACSGGLADTDSTSSETSETDKVRSVVQTRGAMEYWSGTIGGKELTRSAAIITNVKKISDTEYLVSGKVNMLDVYGTWWTNTFDCEVTKYGDDWRAGSFDYTSNKWTKSS